MINQRTSLQIRPIQLLVLLLVLLLACTGKTIEAELPGSWKVVEFNSNTPSLSPSLLKQAHDIAISSHYTLDENGACHVKSIYGETEEPGTWSYDAKANEIVLVFIQNGEEVSEQYQIASVNENKMVWYQDLGELGNLKLHLEKP